MHLAIVSSIQAVRSGLRVMLSELAEPLIISESAGLTGAEDWLGEVDVLIISADALPALELRLVTRRYEGRLAILSLSDDPQVAQSLANLSVRAWGVLTLDCSAEELIAAVNALHEGLLVGSPVLAGKILPQLLSAGAAVANLEDYEIIERLTQRELEVLQLLAQGLSNKQIAIQLDISEHTVKFHVSSIYTRLGVANRAEAVRVGVQRGLISL